jgi:hypothetical protein
MVQTCLQRSPLRLKQLANTSPEHRQSFSGSLQPTSLHPHHPGTAPEKCLKIDRHRSSRLWIRPRRSGTGLTAPKITGTRAFTSSLPDSTGRLPTTIVPFCILPILPCSMPQDFVMHAAAFRPHRAWCRAARRLKSRVPCCGCSVWPMGRSFQQVLHMA